VLNIYHTTIFRVGQLVTFKRVDELPFGNQSVLKSVPSGCFYVYSIETKDVICKDCGRSPGENDYQYLSCLAGSRDPTITGCSYIESPYPQFITLADLDNNVVYWRRSPTADEETLSFNGFYFKLATPP
jgi:hypothetical protein